MLLLLTARNRKFCENLSSGSKVEMGNTDRYKQTMVISYAYLFSARKKSGLNTY
jgi:hypothetical protein